MPTVFLAPLSSDPALVAHTFSNNPTLTAALKRLKTRGARAVNTGAEVPGGSDANDPYPIEPPARSYQIDTVTASGAPSDSFHIAADNLCEALQRAIAQLVETHADDRRVISCREVPALDAARMP